MVIEKRASSTRRFSMRLLLLVVGLFACVFAYLAYFGPATARVEYTFLTAESSQIDALALDLHSQDGSPYRWAYIDRDTASGLSTAGPAATTSLRKQVTIHMWPRQAETATFSHPVFLEVHDPRQGEHPAKLPTFETALFGGFLGVRRAGPVLQFRVEGQAMYHREENGPVNGNTQLTRDQISGELFFEGAAPEHALVFVAPLDEHSHQIILFTLKE